ncbi:MAG: cytochrome c-type biogenesis protein CcmH [Methylococcaceae bacterium]|nr:cytochrome c-type biogenesis protein CcmH [Methylococcaceae bacterium]
MKQLKAIFILSIISFFSTTAYAAIEVYQFDDAEKTARFKKLTAELRCPKCQNQNIADSNAEIARDLRAKLQLMLTANKSDDDIIQYMTERYGDFVLYEPRITGQTFLLWFGPFLLLAIALFIVFLIVRTRSKRIINIELNTKQQKQLDGLLNKKQGS